MPFIALLKRGRRRMTLKMGKMKRRWTRRRERR